MELPKCRTCGERHRLGGCPGNATKNSRGAGSPVTNPDSTPSGLQHGAATTSDPSTASPKARGKGTGAANVAKPQLAPRGTKPAKKAKPKKKGKTKKKRASTAFKVTVDKPISREAVTKAIGGGAIEKVLGGAIRVGPPRKGEEHKTLTATKPWILMKMSRPTWYRKGKPMPPETKR